MEVAIKNEDLMEIFNDSSRVYNCDESSIQVTPKTGKVIAVKGTKNVYEVAGGPEKANLTFLGTFNARGDIVTPSIVYPYVRMPAEVLKLMPENFSFGLSESEWMKSNNFYEFISNVFIEWLNQNNILRPIILFVDGHRSHMSLQLSTLCENEGILLYIFPYICYQ